MDKAFIYHAPVRMCSLRVLAWLFSMGRVQAIHSQIYWRNAGSCWMTELTNRPPGSTTIVIGRGDGYTIQMSRVGTTAYGFVSGIEFECDVDMLEYYAKQYANAKNGLLTSYCHDEPRGHGGPGYHNGATCNTYISWLVEKCCRGFIPEKPLGAWGWGRKPKFPGPRSRTNFPC